ncbi:SDR family NAD(P)-dependent oxidoreductase [Marivita hallyeonensis]|uniref:NAD(P)-dependent dehydrogenase, short-chain alcohol dehydrogenase family n=1 Tax=Marivita hallyeonensis TaxID=996342 RepID=A0A1M5XPA5_9RHOB|nr:SDR family oxidoreductase [Marivita hallyeonensis]SHI01103.1 NAD(P)-dependent dehydrogenase, short-chain alcohol dehydrogenase family [Marivita hallyeonensis]
MGRLTDKTAFVAGAGSASTGVSNGMACAVAYGREGARVFAVDRDATALNVTLAALSEDGVTGTGHVADMTDEAQVAAAVEVCVRAYGTIDILHNNIGTATAGGPVEISEDDWDRVMEINLTTAFLACKYALPVMTARKSGVISMISSLAGQVDSGSAYIDYAASKAAMDQLAQAVAIDNAANGVRCNAILPGLIATPFAMAVPSVVAKTAKDTDFNAPVASDLVPMGHLGTPWDVAGAAVFLASDDARFITGTTLRVDGGIGNTIATAGAAA